MLEVKKSVREKGGRGKFSNEAEDVKNLPPIEEIHGLINHHHHPRW